MNRNKMKTKLTIILFSIVLVLCSFKADNPITIFMIGDSTMANKSLDKGALERGWGQALGGFFTEDVVVDNHAMNGRSSKSFIDEGRWDAVLAKMKPGDYVFIQFGHNDEKPDEKRHTDPGTTFDDNLRKFVNETRAKGGIPVLFNAIVRRNFYDNKNAVTDDDVQKNATANVKPVEGDSLIDTHGDYLNSPRNVAKELNVPFIDMNRITHDLVLSMGVEGSKKLFLWVEPGVCEAYPNGREDNTHLNVYGARTIAGLTVDAIAKEVPALSKYVRHYDYVVAKDGSGDFFTLQEAYDAAASNAKDKITVLLRPGKYTKAIAPKGRDIQLTKQTGAVIE